ncbi:VOC family protein [Nitrospirillum iridis]|uniref:Catechol 2,3-dioxygenase-like lactoylglutathione lyase family enzyme n=1 Tax=Nitrospirillum iridis TaxID=765888 RepID=A0A7X0B151_9PROT|nr:VOC family protein [Nitrospirillum iridis]MBB6253760.1 catechol 2,3-dioxygenase-like lactoylglutathione lyase family enzyme [Nitrospirillum iridis]
MNIIGPDALVFGVDDVDACSQYLTDYGLKPTGDGRFEALDGTCVIIRAADDPTLPPAIGPAPSIREIVYGVGDAETLEAIAAELSKDREVRRGEGGSVHADDDSGFHLSFALTIRRPYTAPADLTNAPGHPPQRGPNLLGVEVGMSVAPRTLSHVVLFVPNMEEAEAFYVNRLAFRVTDKFTGTGPFLRPAGTDDHHTLFLIQTPPFMKGVEHFTFHLGSGTEVLYAGSQFQAKGYTSFWGPGRHLFGSNWFWYFNSPLGCHVEYDADMDLHDDEWIARHQPVGADTSQLFLFKATDKWFPSGPPPKGGAH